MESSLVELNEQNRTILVRFGQLSKVWRKKEVSKDGRGWIGQNQGAEGVEEEVSTEASVPEYAFHQNAVAEEEGRKDDEDVYKLSYIFCGVAFHYSENTCCSKGANLSTSVDSCLFPLCMFLLLFLLLILFPSRLTAATIKCKNETMTLGKKGVNFWNLTGTLSASQNCQLKASYQIAVPTFSSALVTAKLKMFSEGHRLIISDQYGTVIQNQGETFEFLAELPAPSVTIQLIVGSYEDETTAPVIDELSVRNVAYDVFEPPYEQYSADVTPETRLTGKRNVSILYSSTTSNVRLSVFSLKDFDTDLLNVHVYSYTDDWIVLGTLFSPAAWENHNTQHLGVFITRRIEAAVSLVATTDSNIAKYKGWNASLAIVDQADTSRGPSFCLGPDAEAFTIYTMPEDYESRGLELSDLIVTAIEGNFSNLTVMEKFPSNLGNPAVYWTFSPTTTADDLPQMLYGNVKTFVIEGGHACINTSNSPTLSGWRLPKNGRRGFVHLRSSVEKNFYFKTDDDAAWKYNFTFLIEGLPYGSCKLNVSLAGNSTTIMMTNFLNDPFNTVVFDSEYVNGTISTSFSSPVTVIFAMTSTGGISCSRLVLAMMALVLWITTIQ